jgi:hypothetical protein
MSRVELTSNLGPEAFTSWDKITDADPSKNYSSIIDVRLYTLHSYQVHSEAGNGSVQFQILGSNYTDPATNSASSDFQNHWSLISDHAISGGENLAYCDFWNFKYSCIRFIGSSTKSIKVFEKHNA